MKHGQKDGWPDYLLLDTADKEQVNLSRPLGFRSDQRIAAYLSEEVVKQWGEAENSFMMKTPILQARLTCDALTGRKDGQEMLQRLVDHNAFIIAFDHEGGWYVIIICLQNSQKKLDSRLILKINPPAGRDWYESRPFAEAIDIISQDSTMKKQPILLKQKAEKCLES